MKKLVRCTVCTWRGTSTDAERSPRVPRSDIPPPLFASQAVYDDAVRERMLAGERTLPPCPSCGHHLTGATHRRRRGSIHP